MTPLLQSEMEISQLSLKEIHEAVRKASNCLDSYSIAIRRELHMKPELSWEEEGTLALIKRELEASTKNSSLHFTFHESKGGIWVDLTIDESYPRILFRADIDALPIQEQNELEYASKVDGVMHACGHDCHTAMLLSAFRAIAEGWIVPKSNIRFVFQRAEEVGGEESGGALLVKDGVCDGVNSAYGLHIGGKDSLGVFYSKPGMMLCNPTTIEIEIEASGGHVASPFLGTNTIDVMTSIVCELRGIERLLLPPSEPLVFVPSVVKSGAASNVRPNKARVVYALRNFLTDEKKEKFINHVKMKIESIISSYVSTTLSLFEVTNSYPILINNPRSTRFVSNALNSMGFPIERDELSFAGDDFAYYLQKVSGSYWVLGAWQEGCLDHHTAKFNPSESALKHGVAFWLLLASRRPF